MFAIQHKSHPRAWGNPGRVKIELYDELGNAKNGEILTSKITEVLNTHV